MYIYIYMGVSQSPGYQPQSKSPITIFGASLGPTDSLLNLTISLLGGPFYEGFCDTLATAGVTRASQPRRHKGVTANAGRLCFWVRQEPPIFSQSCSRFPATPSRHRCDTVATPKWPFPAPEPIRWELRMPSQASACDSAAT